jgi:hypothetical protein
LIAIGTIPLASGTVSSSQNVTIAGAMTICFSRLSVEIPERIHNLIEVYGLLSSGDVSQSRRRLERARVGGP